MKRLTGRFAVASLVLIGLTACGEEEAQETEVAAAEDTHEAETGGGLPVTWIVHEGDKYTFIEIVPKEDIDMEQVVSTGTFTNMGDGMKFGEEILQYEKDGSLFVIDNTGPTEQWAKFTLK
ncbi:hypothetical protein [Planococcus lenghuensis]|uniref:Uncharacterized protein n=1 Tax=Planococcus lenghuensis TaxID=2213202 RepID=A0A1Q2KVF7_9BACL|nr:hypothetical protein [Planococcus lenghuensis]AQQ52198.1 hypothetical protein B0X71_03100 [Planococcus lenghuensis]